MLLDGLSLEQANIFEEYLITKYRSNNKRYGYNIAKGGLNTVHTKETLKKIEKKKH